MIFFENNTIHSNKIKIWIFRKQYYSPLTLLVGKLEISFFWKQYYSLYLAKNWIFSKIFRGKKISWHKISVTRIFFSKQYYSTKFVAKKCHGKNFRGKKIFMAKKFLSNSIVFKKNSCLENFMPRNFFATKNFARVKGE